MVGFMFGVKYAAPLLWYVLEEGFLSFFLQCPIHTHTHTNFHESFAKKEKVQSAKCCLVIIPPQKKKNHISFTSYFSPTCLCSILQWFHTAPVWAPLPHIITHYHYYASNSIWIANIIICVSNFYWPRKYWWNCCDRRWKVITSDKWCECYCRQWVFCKEKGQPQWMEELQQCKTTKCCF